MTSVVASRLVYAAAATAILVWAPVASPPARIGVIAAVAIGAAVGAAAFLVLARRVPPASRAVALAAPIVAVAAACEEVIWRFAVLGGLRPAVGTPAAVVVSTVAFAAAHAGRAKLRALVAHLVTGGAFAGVYLATNSLAAPIAAHVLYNLLVVAACAAWLEPLPAQAEPAR